jgi:hypothetical protein
MRLEYIKGEENVRDVLTNCLSSEKSQYLMKSFFNTRELKPFLEIKMIRIIVLFRNQVFNDRKRCNIGQNVE